METFLVICTIVGGLAAAGYFIEKIMGKFPRLSEKFEPLRDKNYFKSKGGSITKIDDFYYANNQFCKNVSWDRANDYSKRLKIGNFTGWVLPSIEQLAVLRSKAYELKLPKKYCYWSSERKGKRDAFYMHFDNGDLGNSPRSYNNGLCAIFIMSKNTSTENFQFSSRKNSGLSIPEIIVLEELRNKPDIFWTRSNIYDSIILNQTGVSNNFTDINSAITKLIQSGYLRIDNNNSLSVTNKAVKYYRKFPRSYQK
jgi:hypothetical protein